MRSMRSARQGFPMIFSLTTKRNIVGLSKIAAFYEYERSSLGLGTDIEIAISGISFGFFFSDINSLNAFV